MIVAIANFIVLVISFTIFRRIVLNNEKKLLREKKMLPTIKIERCSNKITFSYGSQTFNLQQSSDLKSAEFMKERLIIFFDNYKNGIIDEIS